MESNTLSLDLGALNGVLAFSNWEEFRQWYFAEYKDKWKWANRDYSTKAEKMNGTHTVIRTKIASIDGAVRTSSFADDPKVIDLKKYLENAYLNEDLIYSKSPLGNFLVDLSKAGIIKACAALDYLTNNEPPSPADSNRIWERIQGIAEAVLYEKKIVGQANLSQSLEGLFDQYQEAFAKAIDSCTTKEALLANTIRELTSKSKASSTEWSTVKEEIEKEKKLTFDDFKNRMSAIESTYREAIQLKAPVDYWENQKNSHNTAAIWYISAFSISSVAYVASFLGLAFYLQSNLTELGYEKYGLLALFATVGGAGVRILYKLFINNIHGKSVAQEKIVQIKTFLALAAEGNKMGSVELNLLLGTILRPRSTSLLKDEYPVVSPIEIIQKLVKS